MKKVYNITQKAAVAVLAILLAASCVFEKENPVGHSDARQHVAVQLGIGTEGMAQTKADDNTGIPITTPDAENPVPTIETKIKTLRIYAYTKEGANYKLCGYYQAFAKADGTFNTTGHVMDLNLPSSGTVKVYFRAVANESAMLPGEGKTGSVADNYAINAARDPQTGGLVFPDAIGFDELNNILYTVDQKFENGMPMYADQEVSINVDNVGPMNTADGHNGHFILQESVNLILTRSLAKIEVYAAESASETTGKDGTATTSVTITGVSLANVPQSGNLFTAPAADASITYTTFKDAEGKETAYSGSFLSDGTVNKKVNGAIKNDIEEPDNYALVSDAYYLAENNQGSAATYEYGPDAYTVVGEKILTDAGEQEVASAATVLKIDYSLDGGKTSKPGYVKMPQIKRNTWYKVLARIQANGELALTLKVQEWSSGQIKNVDFKDEVTLSAASWNLGDGVINGENGNIIFGPAGNLSATYSFTLDTPVGGKWYASLDGDIQNFVLETGEGDSMQSGKTVSGNITAQPTSVTVKTFASNADQGQKTATFKLIARTADETRTLTVKFDTDGTEYYTLIQNQ